MAAYLNNFGFDGVVMLKFRNIERNLDVLIATQRFMLTVKRGRERERAREKKSRESRSDIIGMMAPSQDDKN